MPYKMVNKKLLSFILLALLFLLLGLGTLSCKDNKIKPVKEGQTSIITKKGDEKMDTKKWLSEDEEDFF